MKKLIISLLLFCFIISNCATLKPHPRPWTSEEIGCGIAFTVAHLADAYTTERCLDYPQFYEKNPILDEHPGDAKIGIYVSLTGLGAWILAYFYPQLRKPLFVGYGSLNAHNAIQNWKALKNTEH